MARNQVAGMSYARAWFYLLGVVLLLFGVLGLFPAAVNAFHNIGIHLEGGENALHWILGIAHIGVAMWLKNTRTLANVAMAFGVVYLLVAALGLFIPDTIVAAWWHLDAGDNWLHLLIGLVTLGAGWATRNASEERAHGRAAA